MTALDLATDNLSPRSIWIRHTRSLYDLPPMLSHADLVKLGITFSNVYLLRLEKDGRFPKRIPLGGVTTVWSTEEILSWLYDRSAERETANAKRSAAVRGVVGQREASRAKREAAAAQVTAPEM